MAQAQVSSSGGGLWGLAFLVTIVFFILKIVGVIAWSWWWVFSPLLIAAGLSIVGLVIGLIFVLIVGASAVNKSRSYQDDWSKRLHDRNRRGF